MKHLERSPDFYEKARKRSEFYSERKRKSDERSFLRSTMQIMGTDAFKAYSKIVWQITESQDLYKVKNIDKRKGFQWQLDHKISICTGFKMCILPSIIGSIDNLQMIPMHENMKKGTRCYSIIEYCK